MVTGKEAQGMAMTTVACDHIPEHPYKGNVLPAPATSLELSRAGVRVVLCRDCAARMTGYPRELTTSLDRFIFGKLWGRVEVTFQAGVPGQVYPQETLRVGSWQHPFLGKEG